MFGKNKDSAVVSLLKQKAEGIKARILLPEVTDERVLEAAVLATKHSGVVVVLLGKREKFDGIIPKKALSKMDFIDPKDKQLQIRLASLLYELRSHKGMTVDEAREKVADPMYFSMLLLQAGMVDGVVAGAVTHTADVLRPAFQIVRAKEDVGIVSSVMLVDTKNPAIGENGLLVMGDCGVVVDPTVDELAAIAVQSAATAKELFDFNEPRVALLSFSTKDGGNKISEPVQKVKDAFLKIRRLDSKLAVDGELQVDSALSAEVAKQKCPNSKVAGRANVLVFPDLNSGNIGYKLAARVGGAEAVGPVLQGLNRPVNDLSRGATAEEIYLEILITAIQAENNKK